MVFLLTPMNSANDLAFKYADLNRPGDWYVYGNISYNGPQDEVNAPRDASGMVIANGGRHVLNFGGTHYQYYISADNSTTRRRHVRYSTIRSLDR